MPTNRGPNVDPIEQALEAALAGRMLLTHPFYRRWEAGELSPGQLPRYSSQYRHFEATLPTLLGDLSAQLTAAGSTDAATIVRKNLQDELGNPCSHLQLFDRFMGAVGGKPDEPTAATDTLTSTYADLVNESAAEGLAGLAAYETQASAIAWTKAEGLRVRYGIDEGGISFWDVHASMEVDHGDWILDALASLDTRPDQVKAAARRGADAWWGFLDDREAEVSAAVA